MAKLPMPQHATVRAIYAWHESQVQPPRPYLGVSRAGEECERRMWAEFRWCWSERFDGRMLRLFRRGAREEQQFIDELRAIGVEVHEANADGQQWSVEAVDGHVRGHLDAAARGFAEAPTAWAVCEFKTHNEKSFKELVSKGVRESKPEHFEQMNTYAGLTGMERMAYLACCKNTDALHFEWLHFDRQAFERTMERLKRVVYAAEPLPRLSDDRDHWKCKLCPGRGQCHGTDAPRVTCRSCAHATPVAGGAWTCELHRRGLSLVEQRAACPDHRYIPALLARFAEPLDATEDAVVYRNTLTGATFANGDPPHGLSSHEIAVCADKRALGDAGVQSVRAEFDARVVA